VTDIILTQAEADDLIAMKKRSEHSDPVKLPDLGGTVQVPLVSVDFKEKFILDVSRGSIDLQKATNQTRSRQVVVLVRLDYGGAPHRNPDGQEINCPHIHIYREGYADKWAYSLPDGVFSDLADHWKTLQEFMGYCHVEHPPNFRRSLFS
jgi:Family of unknown function (DUF6978)